MLKTKIQNLIALIEGTEIEEIEVSSFWGAQKIRLSKSSKKTEQSTEAYVSRPESEIGSKEINISKDEKQKDEVVAQPEKNIVEEIQEELPDLNLHEIKAPLVGTFYSSPKPSDPPFINVGDKINKGDTVCIIEAMKIFNEIESDVNGTVKEICADNGTPVEFDQLIIKISVG